MSHNPEPSLDPSLSEWPEAWVWNPRSKVDTRSYQADTLSYQAEALIHNPA